MLNRLNISIHKQRHDFLSVKRLIYIRAVIVTLPSLLSSLLAMIPSTAFNFPWSTPLSTTWFRPRCCLNDLPDDVLLDGVLHMLTGQEGRRASMVNKRF